MLNKLFYIFATLLLLGCGTKVPFQKAKAQPTAAQVYIYAPIIIINGEDTEDINYKLYVDGKKVDGTIRASEYKLLNIKPSQATISVIRDGFEEKKLNFDFKAGVIYYLKIKDNSNTATFEFFEINNQAALIEISKTDLADSMIIE